MQAAAERVFAGIRDAARADGTLDADSETSRRIRDIARRLIAVSGALRADAPDWRWEVLVLRSPMLDVWCLPGGKLIVHSALVTAPQLSDDETAAAIAHEIAHALREHARERAGMSEAWRALPAPGAASPTADGLDQRLTLAFQLMTQLPNSVPHETEADRLGVELAARAGFDPRAVLSLLVKLDPGRHKSAPEWTLRHPSGRTRARDLAGYADRLAPLRAPTSGQ
jgi:predicted Zn-dependent protease